MLMLVKTFARFAVAIAGGTGSSSFDASVHPDVQSYASRVCVTTGARPERSFMKDSSRRLLVDLLLFFVDSALRLHFLQSPEHDGGGVHSGSHFPPCMYVSQIV